MIYHANANLKEGGLTVLITQIKETSGQIDLINCKVSCSNYLTNDLEFKFFTS